LLYSDINSLHAWSMLFISISISIYLSIHLSIYPSIYLSIHLSIYLYTYIYIYPSFFFWSADWRLIFLFWSERATDQLVIESVESVACFHPIPRTERIPTFAGSWTFNIPRSTSHASNTNQGYPPYSNVAMEIPISKKKYIYIYQLIHDFPSKTSICRGFSHLNLHWWRDFLIF
jgi:hypothetical protein